MAILVTGNKNKALEFKKYIKDVEIVDFDYPEIRSYSCEEVAREGAIYCFKKFKKTVIVEDSGLFIDALDGFPGAFTKTVYSKIGNWGILKIMEGIENRRCWYKSSIAIATKDFVKVYTGEEEGIIALKEEGEFGWGQDSIFIPKGYKETYGVLKGRGINTKFRRIALEKMKNDNLF